MKDLKENLVELIRKTAEEFPSDALRAIEAISIKKGTENFLSESSSKLVDPVSLFFFVEAPAGFDQVEFEKEAKQAVTVATKKGYLLSNSVEALTGKVFNQNVGQGNPVFYFHQIPSKKEIVVRLLMKGADCENAGAQYTLSPPKINGEMNFNLIKDSILDAVSRANGNPCGPWVLGVAVGGDRAMGYHFAREQFLRPLMDINLHSDLARLEMEIVEKANQQKQKIFLIGCKIGHLSRLPKSFFVTVSFMGAAYRRQGLVMREDGKIKKWLY